ncbi:DUF4190 domain-containing protein [Microbacterium luticocti]|uniref:DUF4190 domain-containing protein n=1 Tax=Microbacterium luticocti TaxID=451764 RepID=UPI000426C8C7|nr:DUF4190 domain-containing protein [Microbacterium luticocti]
MTTPHDPSNDPQQVPPAPPTAPYGTAGYGQPAEQTAPYGQPAPAAAPYAQPAEQTAPYGQPPQGGGPYTQGPSAPQPGQPDRRPKVLAIVSLVLAVVGVIAALVALVPFIGLPFAIVGIVLLVVAFVLSIVVLASKKQGGKGFGIAALIVSVIGGALAAVSIVASIFWVAVAATSSIPDSDSAPSISSTEGATPSDEATDEGADDGATGSYDEAAYLDDVRPKIRAVFAEVAPNMTDEQIDAVYSDDVLVALGKSMLTLSQISGDDAIDQQAQSAADASGGTLSTEQAKQLMRGILDSAKKYLAE